MRDFLIEIAGDLPEAMFCAAAVGVFVGAVFVWCGVLA